jgi:hypothetical protein
VFQISSSPGSRNKNPPFPCGAVIKTASPTRVGAIAKTEYDVGKGRDDINFPESASTQNIVRKEHPTTYLLPPCSTTIGEA